MIRRARIALALFALATLCAAPAVFADGEGQAAGGATAGGDLVTEFIDWLIGVVEGADGDIGVQPQTNTNGDEFNPQHLPGG